MSTLDSVPIREKLMRLIRESGISNEIRDEIQPIVILNPNEVLIPIKPPQIPLTERGVRIIRIYTGHGAAGTTTEYTVPDGKIFFLAGFALKCDATASGQLLIRQDGATIRFNLLDIVAAANAQHQREFPPIPIKLDEGFYIECVLGVAGGSTSIFGWEENA